MQAICSSLSGGLGCFLLRAPDGGWRWRLPERKSPTPIIRLMRCEHSGDDVQQFAHDGHQDLLGSFASRLQLFGPSGHRRIMAARTHSTHVQRLSQLRGTHAIHFPALVDRGA